MGRLMKRAQAEALIGHQVRAWTAANGVYVGTLEAISGSPWRGVIRITGILEVAQHLERGAPCRRGFRVGEVIEVGHSSIEATNEAGQADYLAVLRSTHAACLERARTAPAGPHSWVHAATAQALGHVIEAEMRRLAGEPWRLLRP